MNHNHKDIIAAVKQKTADGSITWKNDSHGLIGHDADGNLYYLTTALSQKGIFECELSFLPQLRIEGEKTTISIIVKLPEKDAVPQEKNDELIDSRKEDETWRGDLDILKDLEKEARKRLVSRHLTEGHLPLNDEQFHQFLHDLISTGYLNDYPAIKGTCIQLLSKGSASLSSRQMGVLNQVLPAFIVDTCEACGVPIPWPEKVEALSNGGYCSLHRHLPPR